MEEKWIEGDGSKRRVGGQTKRRGGSRKWSVCKINTLKINKYIKSRHFVRLFLHTFFKVTSKVENNSGGRIE